MADPNYQTFPPTIVQGGVGPAQQLYPVPQIAPVQGGSAGLVNKTGQIIGGVQAGINTANQLEEMRRSGIEWQEQQAGQHGKAAYDESHPGGQVSAIPAPADQGDAAKNGFFASLTNSPVGHAVMAGVHAIGSAIAGHTGIPAPGPAGTPPAPPAASGGDLLPIEGHQQGGPITKPEFMAPQPQPVMVGLAKGGVVPSPKPLASPRTQAFRTRRTNDELNSARGGVAGPTHQGGGVGAKTTAPRVTGFGVAQGSPRGMPGFSNGGPIPGYDAGGAIPAPPEVPPMQGSSGGLVNQGAQIIGGVQAGINTANQTQQMDRANTQFNQEQAYRHSAADEALAHPGGAQGAYEDNLRRQQSALHGSGLDTTGVRNDTQGISEAAGQGAQQAQAQGQDPKQGAAQGAVQAAAQPGVTEQTPSQSGKAHSLTWEEWDKQSQDMAHVAALADLAGHDGTAVYQALDAQRNGWVQGHILRNLSEAHVALLNNDQAGVERAMRNANYYLPNGQDLTIQKQNGQIVYQDPIHPYLDPTGAPTFSNKTGSVDNKPNMIPVDAAHLQQLGTAFLDPMKVQDTILATRASYAKMQLQGAQATATVDQAIARNKWADAWLLNSQAKLRGVASSNYKNIAEGDAAEARSRYLGASYFQRLAQGQKVDPTVAREALDAANGIETLVRGTANGKVPPTDAAGNPMPNVGATIWDTSRVPADLKHIDGNSILGIKSLASDFVISNEGRMSSPTAQQLALQVYRMGQQTHVDPATRKPVSNVNIDRVNGYVHLWDPAKNTWGGVIRMSQYGAQRLATGGIHQLVDQNDPLALQIAGGSEGGALPPQQNDENPPSESEADSALGTTPPSSEADQSE